MFSSLNYLSQSQWQPVKTITLNNCTGNTQTITWDGSLNNTVNSQSALSHDNWTDQYNELLEANNNNPMGITVPAPTVAEPWTYTYDITVTQTDTETYTFSDSQTPVTWSQSDNAHLRSDYLTINRAKDDQGNYIYHAEFVDATYPEDDPDNLNEDEDYIIREEYYSRFYTLKDSLNTNASSISVLPFNTELIPMESIGNSFVCQHSGLNECNGTLATYSGITHEINMGIQSVNDEQVAIFTVSPTDNHGNLYRNHINKKSLDINSKVNVLYLWVNTPNESYREILYNACKIIEKEFSINDIKINVKKINYNEFNPNIEFTYYIRLTNNNNFEAYVSALLPHESYFTGCYLSLQDSEYNNNITNNIINIFNKNAHIIITSGEYTQYLDKYCYGIAILNNKFPGTFNNPNIIVINNAEILVDNNNYINLRNIIKHELLHQVTRNEHCSNTNCLFNREYSRTNSLLPICSYDFSEFRNRFK